MSDQRLSQLVLAIALFLLPSASAFTSSGGVLLVSHSKVWTAQRDTVLRAAIDDDDDDEEDDPFASLMKERDQRRAAIRGRAAELMLALESEDEEEEEVPSATVESAVVAEIASAIENVEDEELLNLVEVSLPEGDDEELEYEEGYYDEEEEIEEDPYAVDDDENYPDEPVSTRELFDKLFELADADSSGGIDSDEFVQLYGLLSILGGSMRPTGSAGGEKDTAKAEALFASMDEDGSGTIEIEELKEYLISEKVEEEWPELYEEISSWG